MVIEGMHYSKNCDCRNCTKINQNNMTTKRIKPERKIAVGEIKYRKLLRRDKLVLKAKVYGRLLWNVLKQVEEVK